MNENYIIVLFKNKIKKKIINKFKTDKQAFKFYNSLVEKSNQTNYYKKYENGVESSYDLALLEVVSGSTSPLFMKDDFGRQIKIELEDSKYNITKIITNHNYNSNKNSNNNSNYNSNSNYNYNSNSNSNSNSN